MAETNVISPHDQHLLVNRLRAGDMAAFTEIYQTYTERMITWAINILFISVRNSVLKVIRRGKVKERVFDQIEKHISGEP